MGVRVRVGGGGGGRGRANKENEKIQITETWLLQYTFCRSTQSLQLWGGGGGGEAVNIKAATNCSFLFHSAPPEDAGDVQQPSAV